MFKVGEIVYCVDNKRHEYEKEIVSKDIYVHPMLFLNTPYTIIKVVVGGITLYEIGGDILFYNDRFIIEKEYKISKRLEKINKIKDCLTSIKI